jgi:hypothetical protein
MGKCQILQKSFGVKTKDKKKKAKENKTKK